MCITVGNGPDVTDRPYRIGIAWQRQPTRFAIQSTQLEAGKKLLPCPLSVSLGKSCSRKNLLAGCQRRCLHRFSCALHLID
jgi:hypothetical protein